MVTRVGAGLAGVGVEILTVQFKQGRRPERGTLVRPEPEIVVNYPVQTDFIGGTIKSTRLTVLCFVDINFRITPREIEFQVLESFLTGQQRYPGFYIRR